VFNLTAPILSRPYGMTGFKIEKLPEIPTLVEEVQLLPQARALGQNPRRKM
jgi:hypothetical protein